MTLYPRVRVGAAEVYVTGTVMCRPGQIVEITPLPAATGAYRIQLSFVENQFVPSRIDISNLPQNVVLVTFTNFGTNFISTSAPLTVGLLAGTPMLLDVAGSTTGSGASLVRLITYTVLLGNP